MVGAILASSAVSAQTKLLRFPDIHGDRVVFTYAGDLWLAPTSGGKATRLTAHPGVEQFARFSPDGKWIAFTGQYDGDEQVYVVPAEGGVPTRLTFYPAAGPLPPRWGSDNQVYDWTPAGDAVLFRSMRYGWSLTDTQLFTVSVDGGLPQALPMPESGAGDFSPDGKQVVYTPLTRDFRTWKRYQGGWAQDLYIFDLDSYDLRQITDDPRSDRDPMWIGGKIYFTSDRDGTLNLYAFDVAGGETDQLTHSTTWDVRWPGDDGEGRIVYELNGELQIYDIATGRSQAIAIEVPDDGLWMRPERISAADRIEDWSLSPKGERALFVARGDVFTAPIENGPTRNLTRSSGAHDKWARWSPDGKQIAFISDRTGEDEVYLIAQDGSDEPRQLTRGGKAMRYAPEWSPKGTHLAFSDKDGKLYVLDIDTEKLTEVADERDGQIFDYTWSPHGGHIAFTLTDPTGFRSIYIWSRGDGKTRRVTGEMFNDYGVAWDPEGNYLYFLSDHSFAPQISSIEWNYALSRETYLYTMALRKDVENPFAPESDEVSVDEKKDGDDAKGKSEDADEKKAASKDDEETEASDEPIAIDFDGLAERVTRVPVDADNYGGLSATGKYLVYVRTGPFFYGRSSGVTPEIKLFDLEEREEKTLTEDARGYALSRDGKKILVQQSGRYKLYDVKPESKDAKVVSTDGLKVDRIPAEEWQQIFGEVWRRFRDFFYAENMHGYDWEALRTQYSGLLEHVAHRSDLNYVIGEMIAELSAGHSYIGGGDFEIPDRQQVALPGATFELDEKAGRYRLAEILLGQNEEPRYRAPLTAVGVEVEQGAYVLAIDGEELKAGDNPYHLLIDSADRPVTFTVNDTPTMDGAREVTFEPVTNEDDLRYLAWVRHNYERVEELSGGRVGYMHIPDMGASGLSEFIKWFYPQIRKQGLVVDARGNGGGNVSQMLIERLGRDLLGTRFARTYESARTYPATVFYGHMACLLNEDSASDGDIFPHMFRQAGLGPLIGKRSWGGVVGITGHGPLIDGGSVFVPQFGTNAIDGSYIIEGHGVEPDIEVENDPKSVIEGRDPQLERAVQEILSAIEKDPKVLPTRPPDPVKTK
jgi:tricorn protease